MKRVCAILVLFAIMAPQVALSENGKSAVPTTDVQGCVGGKQVNNARIRQSSDINMAACVQAGRENNVLIEQDGQNNTARAVQGETGRPRR